MTHNDSPLQRADLYKLAALLILLAAVISVFNALYIVPQHGNLFDFFPRWAGGRMVWQGESPYTPAATDAIQQAMFGGALPPTVDQQRMVYPAYVAILIAPLLALPSPAAIAIWLTLQFLAVLLTPILWLQIIDWKPPPWLLGLLIVGLVLVFRYPVNLYLVGQFTGTILFGFSLAVYLLLRHKDAAAGIVLAVTAMPPTIAIPLALALLLAVALVGRWRALAAFAAALLLMTAITFARIGWWIPDFITQLSGYSAYAAPVWAPGLIEPPLRWLLVGALLLLMLGALYRFRQGWALENYALTAILVCLLLLPQTGNYYLVLLIPPLLILFQRGGLAVRIAVLLAILSPWYFHTLPNPAVEALVLPLYVLALWGVSALRSRGVPPRHASQHPLTGRAAE